MNYLDLGHAKPVPAADLDKSEKNVFYLTMHAVKKDSSPITKTHAVLDVSAKSSLGPSTIFY